MCQCIYIYIYIYIYICAPDQKRSYRWMPLGGTWGICLGSMRRWAATMWWRTTGLGGLDLVSCLVTPSRSRPPRTTITVVAAAGPSTSSGSTALLAGPCPCGTLSTKSGQGNSQRPPDCGYALGATPCFEGERQRPREGNLRTTNLRTTPLTVTARVVRRTGAQVLEEVNPPGACDRVRRPVLLR